MNKYQAIDAMHAGKKVTHEDFTDEEWLSIVDSHYVNEKGCPCTYDEFWKTREDNSWAKGWSIFEKQPEIQEILNILDHKR
jgi:hypothetical protein